jgi:hypothetical protein
METSPAEGTFDLLRMDRQIQRRETRRRLTKTLAWTGLIAVSMTKRGVLGWLLAGGGVYGLVHELLDWRDSRPEWSKHVGPRPHGVVRRLLARHPRDAVDNQSKLSFPASDPPVPH